MIRLRSALAACVLLGWACAPGRAGDRDSTAAVAAAPPARVIDSILPIAEQLRRFRTGVAQVDSLAGGFRSRDSLVQAMLAAATAGDTAALIRMQLSRAEYAWLYYPSHIYTAPPYELDPGTFWMMIEGNGDKGLKRLLHHRTGIPMALRDYQCDVSEAVRPPVHEWNQCTLHLTVKRVRSTEQLFGSIVEIGGRYKFVSYANQF